MPFEKAKMIRTRLAAAAVIATVMATQAAAQTRAPGYTPGATLQQVAGWPDRQVTGVAVSPAGRVFVNLPRWTQDVPASVAEVVDGQLRPYPDAEWNSYRNARPNSPGDHFVCVQSVVFDHAGKLWALDPASPGQEGPVKGGPKMVQIDTRANRVIRVLPSSEQVAPPGSYMNDVRFSPDDRWAYLTDSGVKGSLVVVDCAPAGPGGSWTAIPRRKWTRPLSRSSTGVSCAAPTAARRSSPPTASLSPRTAPPCIGRR